MGDVKVRAKFLVSSVTQYPKRGYDEKTHKSFPDGVSVEVKAQAVMGNTNKRWATASPSGELRLVIDNPAAQSFFTPGKSFYLDFSDAPEDDVE